MTPPTSRTEAADDGRSLGLFGAIGVGVGAIVGGGILALAGTAFAATGPSAVVAFAANGVIALLTVLTFAEMATSFPESGGTYTFAKKVLSVEAAFMVGWVVWFASIVAAMLYALGFGTFAAIFLERLWITASAGAAPELLRTRPVSLGLGLAATAFYTRGLLRKSGGGGQWETVGKVVVFLVLLVGGLWAVVHTPTETLAGRLDPFFAAGGVGLIQAMGYTFIALQGFDLIAAVGGEVKSPRRNLPRAMIISLLIALAIYLPFLMVLATVGVTGDVGITAASQADPEAVVVAAVENYLGKPGLWLILVAALLSMLSALQANLLAASHIAFTMARDRNLPARLRVLHSETHTPAAAVAATGLMVALILVLVPNVATAGTVSSLIFLFSFALTHWTSVLARRRGGGRADALRLPFFPLIPVLGGGACLALAIFQGVMVPSAGVLAAVWLAIGSALYVSVFSPRAKVADAAAKARDPQLMRLAGQNPLVLVPVANPASAGALVTLASALAPGDIGRVLLLNVVKTPERWDPTEIPPQLVYAQQVLGKALVTSFASNLAPEALTTIAERPWDEILRVAAVHRCESLLLGLGSFENEALAERLEHLLGEVDSNVVLSRIPTNWRLSDVRRILVPVAGRRDQSYLRARLLGSLGRTMQVEVVYLAVVRPSDGEAAGRALEREIQALADDEVPGLSRVEIVRRDDVAEVIVERARSAEMVILGLQRQSRKRKSFGDIPVRVARETEGAVIMISRRG